MNKLTYVTVNGVVTPLDNVLTGEYDSVQEYLNDINQ